MNDSELLNEIRKILNQDAVPDNDDSFRLMLIETCLRRHRNYLSLGDLKAFTLKVQKEADYFKEFTDNVQLKADQVLQEIRYKQVKPEGYSSQTNLDILIDDTDFPYLSVRAYTRLKYNLNVRTLRDLVSMRKSDLIEAKGLGPKTVNEIRNALNERGLCLRDDLFVNYQSA